jgi:hypothetical protein
MMFEKRRRYITFCLQVLRYGALPFVVAASHGQVSTGSLEGTITDPAGFAVPQCSISVTSSAQGTTRKTVTDQTGVYSVPSLTPGEYDVDVTCKGFGAQQVRVDVPTDQKTRRDFTLSVSGTNTTVQVDAQGSAALERDSHQIESTITSQTLQDLPQSSRDVFSKLDTTPSVQTYAYSNGSSDIDFFGTGGNSLSIGGTTNGNTSYLQDGVLNYNLLTKTANLQPAPENVSAVNVQANGASARYDEPGVVNVVTKSGSNRFHGQAYDYIQNDDFDARGYFDSTNPQQRYNQFGISIGGPILRNRIQFFFAYDGTRQHSLGTDLEYIPTQAMFSGNFGSTTIIDPLTGQPFPNSTIPTPRISSFASAVIAYYPQPNGSYANGTANYSSQQGSKNNGDSYLGRLDYQLSSKDSIYGAYITRNPILTYTSWIAPEIFDKQYTQEASNGYVLETHTFSPTLVNVARFGYNYSNITEGFAGAGKADYTQQFGVPLVTPSPTQEEPPKVSLSGYSAFGDAYSPDGAVQHVYQYADELNQVIRKHSLFYGIEADRFTMDGSWVIWNNGEFDFNGQFTGNSVADFLLGYPYIAYGGIGYTTGNFHQWMVMPYIQDDWRIGRATVNLGIRYDFYQSPADANGNAGYITFPSGALKQGSYTTPHDSVAPRIGVAYSIDDKTVLRSGYGIYYSTFLYNELQFTLAHQPTYTLESNSFGVNQPTPIADTLVPPTPGSSILGTFTTASTMPTPMIQQWNVALERSLGWDWTATVAYLGNSASNLQMRYNANQATLPADPANPTPIQDRRPYPNLGDIYTAGDVGWANYNGLQLELAKRFTHGFSFDANYVYSKALDLQSEDNQNPRTGANIGLDYGPADFDRRHVFKMSGVWELPFGQGKTFANSSTFVNRYVVGGWQLSGVMARRSSTPFVVFASPNADIGADTYEFANVSCANPYATTNRSPRNWLNNSCFSQPNGTLGNQGRNWLHGPAVSSLDLAVSKSIQTTRFVTWKLQGDLLNALNHPQWSFPYQSQNVSSPQSLGQASYLGSPRIIQLSLHAIF